VYRDAAGDFYYTTPVPVVVTDSPGSNPEPPTIPDTVVITITPVNSGREIVITIKTKDGKPVPANVEFYVWFMIRVTSSSNSYSAKDTPQYHGPFVVKSATDASGNSTLDIDVNNLVKPDGTKGSIPKGTYTIKFADSKTGETYVGTIEDVKLEATQTDDPDPDPDSDGGCNAGYGVIGLLLTGFALRKYLTW
jgi:hypothetical protein